MDNLSSYVFLCLVRLGLVKKENGSKHPLRRYVLMTRNQVAFAELQETKRHNAEQERQGRSTVTETQRANLAREYETNRSNVAREMETKRSNLINEAETQRSHMAEESNVANRNLTERVKAGETARANQVMEDLRDRQLDHQIMTDLANLNLTGNRQGVQNQLQRAQTQLINKEVEYYDQNENRKEASGVVKFIKDALETAAEVGKVIGRVSH